jgi:hypothetical protein
MDKNYNGWTNYATWLVNLEMFDGINPHEYFSDAVAGEGDASQLADLLKDHAENYLSDNGDGLTLGYAYAFISDVNWYEIAEHMVADYCKTTETKPMDTAHLINAAVAQIKRDFEAGDETAIVELLANIPADSLSAFLSEA